MKPSVLRLPTPRCALPLLALLAALVADAAPEKVRLPGGRELAVDVPDGWTLTSDSGDNGPVSVRVASPDGAVSLQVSLFPDAEGRMASAEDQGKLLEEMAGQFVAGSVEKEARPVPLRPRRGSGFYCVFTDAKLVGRAELPEGEFRHATTGVRTSAGWFGLFTLFSQDTDSDDYRTALDLLRNSFLTASPAPARRRNPDAF